MLQLLASLALWGALASPAGTSKMCPVCSLLGNCTEMACPPTKDACVFGQMELENGILIKNGSCVAPGEFQEGIYTVTYGPHSSLCTACCVNSHGRATRQEAGPEAQHNGVKCPYCSGNTSASCDPLSVMNCNGDQTMCLTLNGTWNGGGPQILKGCATPNVCHLQVNTTLGPEASGFRLISQPECNYVVTPTQPGPPATTTLTMDGVTACFTCSGLNDCDAVLCPADQNYCLQTTGVIALGKGGFHAWRKGSCVAPKDCRFGSSVSAFTYNVDFGFWINSTCCQGNCQAPAPPEVLPVSHAMSEFLCPTCPSGHLGPCNSSFYMQCPVGETECVQLDLVPIEGSWNVTLRGCGSQNLCGVPAATTKGLLTFPGHRLAQRLHCSSSQRPLLQSQCLSGAPPGLRLALSLPLVALGFLALS
ncbi:uncharacterized protein LOC144217666 [Crocuta crocuta]